MKSSKFLVITIVSTILILVFAGVIVYSVDPYQQYHEQESAFEYHMAMNDFAAYNPGIAKNYEYDTMITGSSMSRSFLPSYINEQFTCKTVKLSMAEARGKDYRDLFSVVKYNKNLKRVIMGLDTFAFTVDKDFSSYQKPMYLYDRCILNDMLYLVNMDGLVKSYRTMEYTRSGGKTTTMDDYQNYALSNTFEREKVIDIYKKYKINEHTTEFDAETQTKIIQDNLDKNLKPFIEENPDIEFLFYFPPYSIVRWGITENQKEDIHAMQVIIENLISYDNVSIYFCQGNQEMITDLDKYMDTIHFNSEVANEIIDDMKNGNYKLTESNYMTELEEFYVYINGFNYDIW